MKIPEVFEKSYLMCVLGVIVLAVLGIFGYLVLFEGTEATEQNNVMSAQQMKTQSTAGTTCQFYDEEYSNSMVNKPVKLSKVTIMKVGNTYIAVNSGNPDTYAVINMKDSTSNIKSGDKGTVYAIYDGMKPDPNDPNEKVPTFEYGIFEPNS